MPRPIKAYIDLSALQHNCRLLKNRVRPAKLLAVIKADAYGHGALPIAQALQHQVEGFALLEAEVACQMREAGITSPILLLEGVFDETELILCQQNNFMVAVHNLTQLRWLENLSSGPGLTVFLKVNTGMNRLGFPPEMITEVLSRLNQLPLVKGCCLMTHFAAADEVDQDIAGPWMVFEALRHQYPMLPFCAANSAAMIRYPHTCGQWVRPGIALYGVSPFPDKTAEVLGLLPVMHLTSQLIAIQDVAAGQAVGYGATFIAPWPMRIGIVACGYGDGYPRHAPSGTPVLVHDQRCPIVGRISMDMLAVDITHISQAKLGSIVELWGKSVKIEEIARHAGTIAYELMCAITARVRRVYSSA